MAFGDDELQPGGLETVLQQIHKAFEEGGKLVEERRANPTDDLTSVLVTAEVDGEGLSNEEIIMGFALLQLAGNDSTKATFSNGMVALLQNRDEWQKLVDDPSKAEVATEELLRWAPAFSHFRRTATHDVEFQGKHIKEGDKVVLWYPSSNRDEAVYECPHKFDVDRNAEHQAFGAGGRHFCLGTALARLEIKTLLEETATRFPDMELIERAELRAVAVPQPAARGVGPAQPRRALSTMSARHDYDWIVIGSGFGGSVAALRLAAEGLPRARPRERPPLPRRGLREEHVGHAAVLLRPEARAAAGSCGCRCSATSSSSPAPGSAAGASGTRTRSTARGARSSRTRAGAGSPTGRRSSPRTTTPPSGCSASRTSRSTPTPTGC